MICRICLLEVNSSGSTDIFKENCEEQIADLIMNFASVEVTEEDYLPKIICHVCLRQLHDVYDFKNLIVRSDAQLRKVQDTSSNSDMEADDKNSLDDAQTLADNSLKYSQSIVQIECEDLPIKLVSCDQNVRTVCENSVQDSEGGSFKDSSITFSSYKETVKSVLTKKNGRYQCNECQSFFKNRYQLILHKATHTGILPHHCDICKKGFATNWTMNVHRRIHFEERPFKCDQCDKSFKTKSAQIIHRKIHLGIKRHQCKVCGKQFLQNGSLKAHQYTHTNEKPLVCEFCGKHYTSKRALDRHSRNHKGIPNEPCPLCGKLYAGEVSVKIHMKTVHAEERIRFPCQVCNKNFCSKSVLKIHMRIHEGVKPFSCDICGKRFRQASVATLHKRVHTGETPFQCTICDKKFAYKHHLKKHVAKDHLKKEIDLQ